MEATSNRDIEQLLAFFLLGIFLPWMFLPAISRAKKAYFFCGEFPWNLELKSWILRNLEIISLPPEIYKPKTLDKFCLSPGFALDSLLLC